MKGEKRLAVLQPTLRKNDYVAAAPSPWQNNYSIYIQFINTNIYLGSTQKDIIVIVLLKSNNTVTLLGTFNAFENGKMEIKKNENNNYLFIVCKHMYSIIRVIRDGCIYSLLFQHMAHSFPSTHFPQ